MADPRPRRPRLRELRRRLGEEGRDLLLERRPRRRAARARHVPDARPRGDRRRETLAGYLDGGEDARIARVAARVEGLCYERAEGGAVHARWTRVEDTIAFAKLMGWRRIGIATCIGLLEESRRLEEILRAQGLEPVSVCCKVGSVDKGTLGVPDAEKVRPGTFEPACNPVAQARILNEVGTDLNVVVGPVRRPRHPVRPPLEGAGHDARREGPRHRATTRSPSSTGRRSTTGGW